MFVLDQILSQHIAQCLGLLRAQVNGLESVDGDLFSRLLVRGAEGKPEIPHAFLHLNAIGIALAVIGCSLQNNVWLRRFLAHGS